MNADSNRSEQMSDGQQPFEFAVTTGLNEIERASLVQAWVLRIVFCLVFGALETLLWNGPLPAAVVSVHKSDLV